MISRDFPHLFGAARIGNIPMKNRVVMLPMGTAEYLASQGNQVTVVEMLPTLAYDMEIRNRFVLLESLKAANVTMLTRKKVEEVVEAGITVVDEETGEKVFIGADVVVLAIGARPNRDLPKALGGDMTELYTVGDCNQPGTILEAVYEGSRVARRL